MKSIIHANIATLVLTAADYDTVAVTVPVYYVLDQDDNIIEPSGVAHFIDSLATKQDFDDELVCVLAAAVLSSDDVKTFVDEMQDEVPIFKYVLDEVANGFSPLVPVSLPCSFPEVPQFGVDGEGAYHLLNLTLSTFLVSV